MPKEFNKIKINGKPIPEGYVLNNWFASRFDRNKNILITVIGGTGTGKSYSCIKTCEDWYTFRFNEKFPQENICFSISEAAKLLRTNKLRKGEFIIIEEAGVVANALDFQNRIVKFFGFVLQSFRSKNIGVIFNLPSLALLNKTARTLCHGIFQTVSINTSTKKVTLKPFYSQVNPMTGKIYNKYLRQRILGRYVKIERVEVGLPTTELLEVYEQRKDAFVNKTVDNLIEKTDDEDFDKDEINPQDVYYFKKLDQLKREGRADYKTIMKELNMEKSEAYRTRNAYKRYLGVLTQKSGQLVEYTDVSQVSSGNEPPNNLNMPNHDFLPNKSSENPYIYGSSDKEPPAAPPPIIIAPKP